VNPFPLSIHNLHILIQNASILLSPIATKPLSKGCILGQVSSIISDNSQSVSITSKNIAWSSREWSLQASTKSVQKGNIVCLLKGASKPTIIRLCRDYFAVVVIRATPLNDSRSFRRPELLKSITHFSRNFLLIWD